MLIESKSILSAYIDSLGPYKWAILSLDLRARKAILEGSGNVVSRTINAGSEPPS